MANVLHGQIGTAAWSMKTSSEDLSMGRDGRVQLAHWVDPDHL